MKRILRLTVLFIVATLACAALISCNKSQNEEITPACIDILKIGKADCIIINTGSNVIMIDTGEEENLPKINSFMQQKGYDKIDTLILTHYDKDHIGGAASIIADYKVETVIESKFTNGSEYYSAYHNAINEQGTSLIKLSENYTLVSDSCELEIDIPKKNKYEEKQSNNLSLIISLKCADIRFLFCGDAMELRLAEFIEYNQYKYDFVKLPYHGRHIENFEAFLASVGPSYGAITCSNKNPPAEETLISLADYGVSVYETRNGDVEVKTDGKQITVKQ